MAKVKHLFDKETIESIVNSYKDIDTEVSEGETKINPLDAIKVKRHRTSEGRPKFSKLFGWKPKLIPDIPVQVFKASDWDKEAQLHIPKVNEQWVWDKKATEQFALSMHEGDTTLLHGLQGTGKSCLVEQWCALLKIPYWRMSCNRETRESHLVGSPGITYNDKGEMSIQQEPTILTDSLKYGGMFCEDEAFRHNSALVLQSLREKSNRTLILPDAPGRTASERRLTAPEGRWWYVLTDNTCGSGDETGIFDAEVQDASTLDRIDSAIQIDYLSKKDEVAMLSKYCDLDKRIVNGMVNLAILVRTSFKKQTLMSTLSVRGLMSWAHKIELMGNVGQALKLSWYNKLGSDDQSVVADIFHQVFARKLND